jgi:hypothetical protein
MPTLVVGEARNEDKRPGPDGRIGDRLVDSRLVNPKSRIGEKRFVRVGYLVEHYVFAVHSRECEDLALVNGSANNTSGIDLPGE